MVRHVSIRNSSQQNKEKLCPKMSGFTDLLEDYIQQ